jgi:hypothetical protein
LTALVVRAFRGRRNFHLGIGDYAKVVRDEPGQPPAMERAEALRRELAEKSHRSRLGWTHITITPMTEDDR